MKQFLKGSLLFACLLLTLMSCHVNSVYLNREEDKKDAEKVTNKLFELIKTKDYKQTTGLFSKQFYEVSSKEKLFDIFTATNLKLGNLQETKIETWETKRVVGSNPSANYTLVYNNKYEKFESKEIIKLTRDADGIIRIFGYHINSDGFLNLK